ncbi:MAG: (4Fe-4S)-binding protein [Oxalobacter sp.]|nr:MAG: (4Fe-4S)-binding protein [Oxalobacter sp.]
MKELVILSGKGGTGKTSITASFAALANRPVMADCDVDAADLHLLLHPRIVEQHNFYSGHEAIVRAEDCIDCGVCLEPCRFGAVIQVEKDVHGAGYAIDPIACEGCGVCVWICPTKAIDFPDRYCGVWMSSETRFGPMVHAQLGVAAENSGKLVTVVRENAKRIAELHKHDSIIIDGPPGIGCAAIASLAGVTQALAITEPSVSGEHDLMRILTLARHFGIPTSVCVNKWDLNPEMTQRIEQLAQAAGARIVGRIRYDQSVTRAQMLGRTVVETDARSAEDIRQVWQTLNFENGIF